MDRDEDAAESPDDPEHLRARIRELEAQLADARERDDHVCPHPFVFWFKLAVAVVAVAALANIVGAIVDWFRAL